MLPNEVLFTTPRVVVITPMDGSPPYSRLAVAAVTTNGDELITVDYFESNELTYVVRGGINIDDNSGIITFEDVVNHYVIRPLREEDGLWLSEIEIPLPVEALTQRLEKLQNQGWDGKHESLQALTHPPHIGISELIYDNTIHRWLRISDRWLRLDDEEEAKVLENTSLFAVESKIAIEIIDLFDYGQSLTIRHLDDPERIKESRAILQKKLDSYREEILDDFEFANAEEPNEVDAAGEVVTIDRPHDLETSQHTPPISQEEFDPRHKETLFAFSTNKSSTIIGLIYSNAAGRWLRVGGFWMLISDADRSLVDNDVGGYMIKPEKHQEFIELFDNNVLDINHIREYEEY